MKVTGDKVVGSFTRGRKSVEIPTVEHPDAEGRYIVSDTNTLVENAKSCKLLGIEVDLDTLSTVDFDPASVDEEDVVVYHVHAARQREDGNISSHNIIEPETDCLDGFVAAVNDERLPLNQTLRVGDLDGHVGHVMEMLASKIAIQYVDANYDAEDLPDDVEFQLKSHSTCIPEVEIISLGGLAREYFDRDFPDSGDFQAVYSRSELDAEEFESLSSTVREQAVTKNDRRCAELIGCELETKEVTICVPSELFDKRFEEQKKSYRAVLEDLPEDELRRKIRRRVSSQTSKERTYEVLCGVN